MVNEEMFESGAQLNGGHAGVFEYDGETGYFYLYEIRSATGQKVVSAIRVLTGTPDFVEQDIAVRWDVSQEKVGLFICNQLWAVFDLMSGEKYGGEYCAGNQPQIPSTVRNAFEFVSKGSN